MITALDYMRKYVDPENRHEFIRWGEWWDKDFSHWAYYDLDLLDTLHDYAEGK
jgi:hypothetical protein